MTRPFILGRPPACNKSRPQGTPVQRLEILFELNRQWPKDEHSEHFEGMAKVFRIIKF
jgi:hypothetical protein